MKKCTNCGGSDIKWNVGTAGPTDVVDGRLRMSEIRVIAYLFCEECSETLQTVEEDVINDMLNRGNK